MKQFNCLSFPTGECGSDWPSYLDYVIPQEASKGEIIDLKNHCQIFSFPFLLLNLVWFIPISKLPFSLQFSNLSVYENSWGTLWKIPPQTYWIGIFARIKIGGKSGGRILYLERMLDVVAHSLYWKVFRVLKHQRPLSVLYEAH